MLILPEKINKYLTNEEYQFDQVGCLKSKVLLFKDKVLKIEHESQETDSKIMMYQWLQGKLPIPKLITTYKAENLSYLLMSKLKEKMACDQNLLKAPENLIKMLAVGIKTVWTIDIKDCPIDQSLDKKLKLAKKGLILFLVWRDERCRNHNIWTKRFYESLKFIQLPSRKQTN